MRLNAKHKEAILIGLIEEATKKNAPAMKKAANSVFKLWEKVISDEVASQLHELPLSRWADLIQLGAMRPFTTDITVYKTAIDGRGDARRHSDQVGYSWLRVKGEAKDNEIVLKALADNFSLRGITVRTGSGDSIRMDWDGPLPAVPNLSYMIHVDLDMLRDSSVLNDLQKERQRQWVIKIAPVIEQINIVQDKFKEIIAASLDYYFQLTDILASITTDKQLEEAFPEAAKHLPRPVAQRKNEVADVNLINKARKMLVEGIPN